MSVVEFRVISFGRVERTLVLWKFRLYISACGTRYGIVLYFSAFVMRSGIVECYDILFPRMEHALVLWNFEL